MPLRSDTCRDSRRRLSGRAQLEGLFRTPSWLNNFAGCLFLVRRMRKDGIPATSKLWDLSHKLCAATVLAALAVLSGCRIDMHVQPKQNPLSPSDFYPDKRSARPLVEGTVARGQLHEDTYFYTGTIGNSSTPGDYMPFPVTKEVLDRGRLRFNIYCAPCHSRLGDGNGIVPAHGFPRKPSSYHIDRLRNVPLGYFYGVITH